MPIKLIKTHRCIAYICPICSEICEKNVNLFQFSSASVLNLLCSSDGCHEPCVSISRAKDKFKISINCPVCGQMHTFKVSSQSFLFKNLLTFSCPENNIAIFFSGDSDLVQKAVSESCDNISRLAEELEDYTDNISLMYGIIDMIYHKLREGKLVCSCGSHDIYPDVGNEGISLTCEECEKTVTLPPTEMTLDMLETADEFKI